jgi:hypothetical protein
LTQEGSREHKRKKKYLDPRKVQGNIKEKKAKQKFTI